MSVELGTAPAWLGTRNFIVPPDIVPVRRVSPLPNKKRTTCHHRPEGEPVCRAGEREWFSDRLFVDSQTPDLRNACGTSLTVHASCLVGVLVLLTGQPNSAPSIHVTTPLRMPAFVAMMSGGDAGSPAAPAAASTATPVKAPAAPKAVKHLQPQRARVAPEQPIVEAPPPTTEKAIEKSAAVNDGDSVVGPSPSGREVATSDASTTAAGDASGSGAGTGTGTGIGTGPGTGSGSGAGSGLGGPAVSPGAYRLGNGIEPPKKIKDVAPIYPAGALTSRALGTVVIEAVVGTDGRVHDPRVIHSIPPLDEAALEAVRQWEFAPSRLNGVAVAVIVTILVQFAIH